MRSSDRPQDAVSPGIEEPDPTHDSIIEQYQRTRHFTQQICEPLETEDYVVQTMDVVSPTKWHLAHTTWFFETFVLIPNDPGYRTPNPAYKFLFNSYYNAVGDQYFRPHRGFITRPTVAEVFDYRAHVDRHMSDLAACCTDREWQGIHKVVELGINHEQQHQELMLTDIKHVLSRNPLWPSYHAGPVSPPSTRTLPALEWVDCGEGIYTIGHEGDRFAYDNESPRHRTFLEGFRLASRLVTNGEFLAFVEDGGYDRPEHWLSEGWAVVKDRGWQAPLYWKKHEGRWRMFTTFGMGDIEETEPVAHVSYFEADAYARWAGHRLPSEAEWEVVACDLPIAGNFAGTGLFHPQPLSKGDRNLPVHQIFGDVWEWTQSPYTAYPGFKPAEGAIGEYNGKFMCNQYVLRGGSCVTTQAHMRASYRNFFPADARWQFSGIRLAADGAT